MPQIDAGMLHQVEVLHGIDEKQAILRLSREYDASVVARRIEALRLPSFAGDWFDPNILALKVALSSQSDFQVAEKMGAVRVLVAHNLAELSAVLDDLADRLATRIGKENVNSWYIDVEANSLVFGVGHAAVEQASGYFKTFADLKIPIRVVASTAAGFSSNLRGADGTQYTTWNIGFGGSHPCSVGVSAEKINGSIFTPGYLTAGHCGAVGNDIESASGQVLGQVATSTYSIVRGHGGFANNQDGAWVETSSGWLPQPQVNGYTSGTLYVSGSWGGTINAPVGTNVCRYGAASGGPHCATVTARNVSDQIDGFTINGLIKVNGICTNDGDSGGPLMTPFNQVQGTDSGGAQNSCPDSTTDYVEFQPISTTIATAADSLGSPIAMLTSHGRSAPTVTNFRCPDPANSGTAYGIHAYTCNFTDFDSQGITKISWTTSTGASSDDVEVSGTCAVPGPMVSVTLAITNPYGTRTLNRSFSCPTKPMP